MGEQSIVLDTSLLLYLGRIGKVDVLPLLYKEVSVPEKVVQELDAGRLLRGDTMAHACWIGSRLCQFHRKI